MELKNHPKMKWAGIDNWPPLVWASTATKALASTSDIEKSILKRVSMRKLKDVSPHLSIVVEHNKGEYNTVLQCEDSTFLNLLKDVLKKNVGKSIREIGNLEVSET